MLKTLWKAARILAVVFSCLMLGVLGGAWFGGNYAENIRFNGVRGYEASGEIGLLCGVFALFLLGVYYLVKKNRDGQD